MMKLSILILTQLTIFISCLLGQLPLYAQASAVYSNNPVLIYIRDDVYYDYQDFVAKQDVLEITSFTGKNIRRDVVDMVIAQQALKLGGFEYSFKYIPGKVNFRNTKMLENGQLLISFDSYWRSDAKKLEQALYISDEVIRNGDYIAGLYTSPKNLAALSIKETSELSKFTAVSTPKWHTDWQTLSQLPLKDLHREDEWLSMARMVNMQWVDFLLMPFHSSDDRSFIMDKIHLVPVKGIGVVLKDSRHFVISKKHPLGQQASVAINKGLKKLRETGAIKKAYTEAGFFIDQTSIKLLNP
ncbi:hypothetical protein [Thalassotalea sp. PLHSN55]|uniref:hypothetical protein n=1 Tax=Thalassotalea sp. PLHSN55 TaxID=3435888 RepID=UPI003F853C64